MGISPIGFRCFLQDFQGWWQWSVKLKQHIPRVYLVIMRMLCQIQRFKANHSFFKEPTTVQHNFSSRHALVYPSKITFLLSQRQTNVASSENFRLTMHSWKIFEPVFLLPVLLFYPLCYCKLYTSKEFQFLQGKSSHLIQ